MAAPMNSAIAIPTLTGSPCDRRRAAKPDRRATKGSKNQGRCLGIDIRELLNDSSCHTADAGERPHLAEMRPRGGSLPKTSRSSMPLLAYPETGLS